MSIKKYISPLAQVPTLYTWLGGQEVLERLTSRFYDKVLSDDILSPVFKNITSEHARHVAHFIAEVFGGPKLYTEGDPGNSHAVMVAHHLNKMLSETMRKRWLQLLLETADEIQMPDDPEFRSALVGYLEWGSRLAVINSQATDNPIKEKERMPKWGWGETGGPYMP
jgi:hemoglobin